MASTGKIQSLYNHTVANDVNRAEKERAQKWKHLNREIQKKEKEKEEETAIILRKVFDVRRYTF